MVNGIKDFHSSERVRFVYTVSIYVRNPQELCALHNRTFCARDRRNHILFFCDWLRIKDTAYLITSGQIFFYS